MFTDPSTMLTIAFVVIALEALALILLFVHFHGGMKTLLHLQTAAPAEPTIHPPAVDQGAIDAAVSKSLAAHRAAAAPTNLPPWRR